MQPGLARCNLQHRRWPQRGRALLRCAMWFVPDTELLPHARQLHPMYGIMPAWRCMALPATMSSHHQAQLEFLSALARSAGGRGDVDGHARAVARH